MPDQIQEEFKRTTSSIRWSLGSKILGFVVHFVAGGILNKIIDPELFGVVFIALSFTSIGLMMWNLEMTSVLIRDQESNDKKVSTAFWATFAMGTFLFLLFFFLAPFIASFYEADTDLILFIRLFSISFLIQPFSIYAAVQLKKQLRFDILSIIHFTSRLVATLGAVYLAYKESDFWALLLLYGLLPIGQAIILGIYGKWLPKFQFNAQYLKTNFKLSGSLVFKKVSANLVNVIDKMLIGNVYGNAAVGEYSKSLSMQTMPNTYIAHGVSEVMFPAMVNKELTKEDIQFRFNSAAKLLAFLLFPIFCLLIGLADEFALMYFGPKWDLELMTILIRIFSLMGLFAVFELLFSSLLMAKSRSKFIFNIVLIKRLVMIVGIFLTFKISIIAVAIAKLISEFLAFVANLLIYKQEAGASRRQFLLHLLPTLITSSIAAGGAYLLAKYVLIDLRPLFEFTIASVAGGLLFLALTAVIDKGAVRNVRRFLNR